MKDFFLKVTKDLERIIVNGKEPIHIAVAIALIVLSHSAMAQSTVTPLPQANPPRVSEQTKALFSQRRAEAAAAAVNNSDGIKVIQTAPLVAPATAKASPSAANRPENRANQQDYINSVNASLKSGK